MSAAARLPASLVQQPRTVRAFLDAVRSLVSSLAVARAAPSGAVRVVMGNEAGDMDSTVCALALSYFWTQQLGQLHVPVINVVRAEFGLRTDVKYQLQNMSISPDRGDVVFIDEIDLAKLHAAKQLQLTLVDHNQLSAAQAGLAGSIVAVVDHHDDGKGNLDAQPRIIERVGSCATLLVRDIIQAQKLELDEYWAKLLLAPILLDTANLNASQVNFKPDDRQAIEGLLPLVYGSSTTTWTSDVTLPFFQELADVKMDVSRLSTDELLIKDYKQWQPSADAPFVYGISSVALLGEAWMTRDPDLAQALERFCTAKQIQLLLLMLFTDKPTFQRELMVYFPSSSSSTNDPALLAHLEASELRLTPVPLVPANDRFVYYKQLNVLGSRKQVQPIMQSYYVIGRQKKPH